MEGSVVIRRSLGRQLKALRVEARKSLADVVTSGIASKAKLARIESGHGPVKIQDVWALCILYDTDQQTRDTLGAMAQNTSRDGWWEIYDDVMPSWFGTYVELEAAATNLWAWDPSLVPGLLQTPAYHAAVFAANRFLDVDDPLDRELDLRAERQRRTFARTPPLQLTAIVDEAALCRQVGGHTTMGEQRDHLLTMSRRKDVDIRVLRNEIGAHAGMTGAFNRLSFAPDDEPDVIYIETLAGGRYIEQPDVVIRFINVIDAMLASTISIEEYLQ